MSWRDAFGRRDLPGNILPPPAVVIVVNRGTRAATLDRFIDALDDIEGVQLRDLPPLTTLRVRTTNTQYRVVIVEGLDVYIHGGAYFPNPAYACVDGASIGGSMLKIGWIAVGMPMEISARGRHFVTSPVRAIEIQPAVLAGPH